MSPKLITCATLAVALLAASSAFAQRKQAKPAPERGANGRPTRRSIVDSLMQRYDTNKNGELSKEELGGRLKSLLDRADADKDGVVTKAELEAVINTPRRGGFGGPGGRGGAPGAPGGRGGRGGFGSSFTRLMQMMPVMRALDADKDGVLSAKEIENATAALKKLDKNGDGKLTEDEMQPDFSRGRGGFGGRGPRGGDGGPGGFGGPGGRGGDGGGTAKKRRPDSDE